MATNKPTGDGHRNGAVKGRSQTYNPQTDSWVKRDTATGRFMDVKTSSNTPFKGVTKEKELHLNSRYPKNDTWSLPIFNIII